MGAFISPQDEQPAARALSAAKGTWPSIASSLHVKVLLAFVVVALVPLVILALFNYVATRQALTHSANQALFAAASQTAVRLDAAIAANFAVIGAESKLPALAKCLSSPSGGCEQAQVLDILRSFSQKDAVFISSYALLDLQGRNLIDTDLSSAGNDESARDYFQAALETGLPYVSSIESSANDGKAYLYFSSAVADEISGKPLGVLRARYAAAFLQQLVVQDSGLVGARSYPVLLDESGLILADGLSSPGSSSGLLYRAASSVGLADSLEQVDSPTPFFAVQRSGSNEADAAAVTRMKMRPWLVAFLEPQEMLLAPAREQALDTMVLAAVIVFIVAIVAAGVARLLTNPIVHLTNMARHVAKGNLDAKAEIESDDEIGVLAGAFNSMTDQLRGLIVNLEQRLAELDRAGQALKDSEVRLRILVQTIPDLVWLKDPEGIYLSCNPEFGRFFGASEADILGKTDYDFVDKALADYFRANDRKAMEASRPSMNEEWVTYASDGHKALLETVKTPMQDAAGKIIGVLGIARDIAERRATEDQLRKLTVELEERVKQRTQALENANNELAQTLDHLRQTQSSLVQIEKQAALGRMVAGIAHELNTPIGNALIAVSVIYDDAQTITDRLKQGIGRAELDNLLCHIREGEEIARRNLERTAKLVDTFKQVAVDQDSYQRRVFDLKSVMDEILLMSSPSFKHTPYHVENNIDEKIELDSYPGPLGQIIANLIANALLHGFENREYGTVCITATQAEPDWIDICVADDGQGVVPELQEQLFTPFFTTKMGRGGTGLGLHIVHNLTTSILGGSIKLLSKPGEGCRFTLHIPKNAPAMKKPVSV